MDKVYKKVESYVREQFPKKELIRVNFLSVEGEGVEVYGFNSIMVLIKELDGKVFYFPKFNKVLSK